MLIRILISDALRDAGARVVEAENADEALGYLASDPTLQFVFTDVRMPGSIDGLELARRIALQFPHVGTVLTSGHLLPAEVGGELLIPKPYSSDLVAAQLIERIDEHRTANLKEHD